jgi:hypothetical protein
VVAFDRIPESAKELQEMLFGDETHFHKYPADEVAKTVFRDMQATAEGGAEWTETEHKQPLSEEAVFDCFRRGYTDGDPNDRFNYGADDEEWKKMMAKHDKHMSKFRANLALKFLYANKGKFFYQFSYSDNDGDYGSTLEHGDLFKRLSHQKFSEH